MKKAALYLAFILLCGCDGLMRSCASGCAENYGGDWVVVQYRQDGTPFNCWKLVDVSMTNEASSDGIYWQASDGHLVHIGGWYNRVQVSRSNFDEAAKAVGVDLARCTGGAYLP
jgi:hypothetical protein